jgi:hypothetical protein
VVYGADAFWAIEVKHAGEVRRRDLRALLAFREEFPQADLRLLHRGSETLEVEGVRCLPADAFLRALVPGGGLP